MSSIQEQRSPRGEQHSAESSLLDDDNDLSESQPSNPLRPPMPLHSADFDNPLSTVRLTRHALKELDRRTCQVDSPQRPASPARQVFGEGASKEIQSFARHGGPELRDLRGYPAPAEVDLAHAMSSILYARSSGSKRTQSTVRSGNSTSESSSGRSAAYDGAFEQHLIDHHIYPKRSDYPHDSPTPEPRNSAQLYERLAQPRPSLSPSRFTPSDFDAFDRADYLVTSKKDVMQRVLPTIYGKARIPSDEDLVFTKLAPIANRTTVAAKPDLFDGANPATIDWRVRSDLGPFIIPTEYEEAPAVPNFFIETKPPRGGADVAKVQACYDGALGARAIHELQSYGQCEPVYDGNAYTISTTYHDGYLKMYTTHPTQSVDGTPQYHMAQVKGWDLTMDPDGFREGVTALRNARDWAQEQRDAFISAANDRARSMKTEESSVH